MPFEIEQNTSEKTSAWTETYQALYAKGPRKLPHFFDGVVTFHLHNKLIVLRDDIGLLLLESFYAPAYHGGLPTYHPCIVAGEVPCFDRGTTLEVEDFRIEIGERIGVQERDISATVVSKKGTNLGASPNARNVQGTTAATMQRPRQKEMSHALLKADDLLASTILGPQKLSDQQTSHAGHTLARQSLSSSRQAGSSRAAMTSLQSSDASVGPEGGNAAHRRPASDEQQSESPRSNYSSLENGTFMSVRAAMRATNPEQGSESLEGREGDRMRSTESLSSPTPARTGFRSPLKSAAVRTNSIGSGSSSSEADGDAMQRPAKARRLGAGLSRPTRAV